jgi:hypothetical protein
VVKKLICVRSYTLRLIIGGSRPTEVLSKETSNKYILGLTIQGQVQGFGLRIFLVKITRPHNSVRFLDLITHQEVPKLFYQQELRGLVDKTAA